MGKKEKRPLGGERGAEACVPSLIGWKGEKEEGEKKTHFFTAWNGKEEKRVLAEKEGEPGQEPRGGGEKK